jgi:hypothetical protein
MRLEPVYLVGGKKKPSMPTRRAFLMAGSTLVLGVGVWGACGYSVGLRVGRSEAAGREAGLPPTSGDARLDELRRLALVAPIEELAAKWLVFVDTYAQEYRDDSDLPRGVARLIDYVIQNSSLPDRRTMALVLADVVERGRPRLRDPLLSRVEELRRLR